MLKSKSYNRTYKNILITGGAGFLGRHLVESLLEKGYSIKIIDINKPSWINSEIDFFECDFTSVSQMEPHIEGSDVIYHLASTTLPKTSNDDIRFDISTNLLGTVGLLEMASLKKVKKFIFLSSGGTVYGTPNTLPVPEVHQTTPLCSYGIVKLTIEKYLRIFSNNNRMKTISLRLSNPYGEYQRVDRSQGVIKVFCDKALRDEVIEIWGDGTIVRDFIYVKDAVAAMISAMTIETPVFEVNIGSGEGLSLRNLIEKIEVIIDKRVKCQFKKGRNFDIPKIVLDITKAKSAFNWSPTTSIDEGIKLVIKDIQSQPPSVY